MRRMQSCGLNIGTRWDSLHEATIFSDRESEYLSDAIDKILPVRSLLMAQISLFEVRGYILALWGMQELLVENVINN